MGRDAGNDQDRPFTKKEWKVMEGKINSIFDKITKRLDKIESTPRK